MRYFFERSRFSRDLKKLVNEKAAQGEPLCVMDDLVFKAMLTSDTEDSREALRSLLSACIGREVSKVQVTNNDIIPAHLEAKASKLDVHVIFNDGEAADLEMQMSKSGDDLAARAALHAAMLLSAQSRRGHAYKEIKRVYQIFFLNCILFPQNDRLPRRYAYLELEEHDRLTDAVEIIFYEMPKLEQRVQDYQEGKILEENLRKDEKWCIFMKYRHEKWAAGLIEKLHKEAGIMRAERAVSGLSRDYIKAVREMSILKYRMECAQERYDAREEGLAEGREECLAEGRAEGIVVGRVEGIAEGREEGLAEGRAEGLAEGQAKNSLQIARKLKAKGLPSAEIAEVTGLTEKQINDL